MEELSGQERKNLLQECIELSQKYDKEAKRLNKFFSFFKRRKLIALRDTYVLLTTKLSISGYYQHPKKVQ